MAKSRERRSVARWIVLGVVGLLALSTTVLVGATGASAHHADAELSASCAPQSGTIAVTLKVYNSQGSTQAMTLKNVVSSGFLTPDGAKSGQTVAGGSGGKWTTFTFDIAATSTGKISYAFDSSWANGNSTSGNKASFDLPTGCTPPPPTTGGFSVTKAVTGETAGYVAGSTFTVDYSCSNQANGSLTLLNGETKSVVDLPAGTTCTLTEAAPPATTDSSYVYGTPSFAPGGPIAVSANTTIAVTLTNPITRDKGGFSVTKAVTGETAGYVAGSTFTVSYTCSGGVTGSLTLIAGQTTSVSNLPVGTTCTLTEGAKPGTTGPGFSYGAESFSPSNAITISGTTPVAVTLTNPLNVVTGGFSVTKALSGDTAGYAAGSTFGVGYTCSDGTTGSLVVAAGATSGAQGITAGSTCTFTESAPPATSGLSYEYGTPSFAPGNVVTIGANATVGVTLTNPLHRLYGSVTINKTISGDIAGYVAGSTFDFKLDCDGTANDTTVTLAAGASTTLDNIALGTSCTVTEIGIAAPVAGYVYGAPTVSPTNGTVVVTSTTTPVTVSFDNPLVWLPSPKASIKGDCDTDGAVVSLVNKGGGQVDFTVTVDGKPFGTTYVVTDKAVKVLIPLVEDVPADIKVFAGDDVLVVGKVITNDCEKPQVEGISVECSEGGAVVTLSNDGANPVELTVQKDGVVVSTVTVGDDPVEVQVLLDEDVPATVTVLDGDTVLSYTEVTYDCVGEETTTTSTTTPPTTATPPTVAPTTEPPLTPTSDTPVPVQVLGKVQTPAKGTLPVTGGNVFGSVAIALGLLLAGATLVGLARRRS